MLGRFCLLWKSRAVWKQKLGGSLQEQAVNYSNGQTSCTLSLADLAVLCGAGTGSSCWEKTYEESSMIKFWTWLGSVAQLVLCILIFLKVFDILPREPVANNTYYVD